MELGLRCYFPNESGSENNSVGRLLLKCGGKRCSLLLQLVQLGELLAQHFVVSGGHQILGSHGPELSGGKEFDLLNQQRDWSGNLHGMQLASELLLFFGFKLQRGASRLILLNSSFLFKVVPLDFPILFQTQVQDFGMLGANLLVQHVEIGQLLERCCAWHIERLNPLELRHLLQVVSSLNQFFLLDRKVLKKPVSVCSHLKLVARVRITVLALVNFFRFITG